LILFLDNKTRKEGVTMNDTEKEIPCMPDDMIMCIYVDCDGVSCSTVSLVRDLRKMDGYSFPRPGGGYDQSVYWYCPSCGDPLAKVYDRGDGQPLILAANVKLVKDPAGIGT